MRARADVYAHLIDAGVLPALQPSPRESALAYLERAGRMLGTSLARANVTLAFHPSDGDRIDDLRTRGPEATTFAGLTATFTPNFEGCISIGTFENALLPHHAETLSAICYCLEMFSETNARVFGPHMALNAADWVIFNGCPADWWESMREMVSEDEEREEPSNADIRRYIRKHGIRTPWLVRRSIGRHYGQFRPHPTRRAHRLQFGPILKQTQRRIDALPARLRSRLRPIGDALAELWTHEQALRKMNNEDLMQSLETEPTPGACLENDAGIGSEVLDEYGQYIEQGSGFGPVFITTIVSYADAVRLRSIIDHMTRAYAHVGTIINTMSTWE